MPQLIKRSRLGGGQKPERGVKRAGLVFGLRGGQGALGAPRRVGRQSGRAIQNAAYARQTAAGLRASCGVLEFGGNLFVGAECCLRAVPSAAIRIDLGVGHLRERLVHSRAIAQRRHPIHGRARQWMAEPHACTNLE